MDHLCFVGSQTKDIGRFSIVERTLVSRAGASKTDYIIRCIENKQLLRRKFGKGEICSYTTQGLAEIQVEKLRKWNR